MTPEEKQKPETSRKLELRDSNGDVMTYLEQIHNMTGLLLGHLAGDLTVDWEMFTDKKKKKADLHQIKYDLINIFLAIKKKRHFSVG